MSMMNIRIVVMSMCDVFVCMLMTMRFSQIDPFGMFVLVMFIANVAVSVS